MRILAIETSCDETAVAVVSMTDGIFTIEKNVLSSQAKIHAQYGGVVPEVAAREHAAWVFPLMEEVDVPHDGEGIDAIAVTAGPGLVPALRVGVELAKTLAWAWHKPLVAVNHLEGHIYSVWLSGVIASVPKPRAKRGGKQSFDHEIASSPLDGFDRLTVVSPSNHKLGAPRNDIPQFPALCLLVSGGHTELILMRDHGAYELLGMTRDDAAGEAFDKVAKLLGLPYPGGPQISKAALDGNAQAIPFPRPMIDSNNFDLSFAGLKTAVRVYLEAVSPLSNPSEPRPTRQNDSVGLAGCRSSGRRTFVRAEGGLRGVAVADVAASFQQAVVDVLVHKTLKAAQMTQPRSVILAGGVSANKLLCETLESAVGTLDPSITFHAPDLSLTGDNAAMIGAAGAMKAVRGEFTDPLTLEADPNLRLA